MTYHIHNINNNEITTLTNKEELAAFFADNFAVTLETVVEGSITFIRVIA